MLRGLYALACIISSLIGAGAGVFFYDQTKYLIPAMGGFAFAWFIEGCKSSGATGDSVVGRWGLIIGESGVRYRVNRLDLADCESSFNLDLGS
jgi:hypothetical protein